MSPSRWLGEGAKKLNLSGDVDTETFQQLLRGQTPDGQNLFSRKVDIDKRRAATDFTFSAPKSVSIAALVQQDERVVKAHHQAVAKARFCFRRTLCSDDEFQLRHWTAENQDWQSHHSRLHPWHQSGG